MREESTSDAHTSLHATLHNTMICRHLVAAPRYCNSSLYLVTMVTAEGGARLPEHPADVLLELHLACTRAVLPSNLARSLLYGESL